MAVAADAEIHPTAVVAAGARIARGCRIGPYCVIGPAVVLGPGVTLHAHAVVAGVTEIGEGSVVYSFAALGNPPQSRRYGGEPTRLVIGARNTIREHVTMSVGTPDGGGETRVGDDCLFMIGAHVGHDCRIGNRVTLTNGATLAGHVVVEDGATLGGLAAVHQHVRIGEGAMIGGLAGVVGDVIPYGMVPAVPGRLAGLNLVGLKRRGASRSHIHGLRAAFAELFAEQGTLKERVAAVRARHAGNPLVEEVVRFITADSTRALTLPPVRHG